MKVKNLVAIPENIPQTSINRFWSYVIKGNDDNECWNWSGHKSDDGTARMSVNNKATLGSVVSWLIHFEKIEPNHIIYRKCKNLYCTNPNHLISETKNEHLIRRFWDLVDIHKNTECWLWLGCRRGKGYGAFNTEHKTIDAHRLAWSFYNKQAIPKGMCVLHHCDNPPCCNPNHLFLGTYKDNATDKVNKNRHLHGTSIPSAKLDDEKVLEISRLLNLGKTGAEISRQFDISASVIYSIKAKKAWKHLWK